jgi:uncharacterized membrane protein YphA (DoxX/SURF4 family)
MRGGRQGYAAPLRHLAPVWRIEWASVTPVTVHDYVKEIAMQDHRTETAYWALRITFGVVPIVAGLDKFTNLLTDWESYVSPLAARLLPVSPHAFMLAAGIVEIVVGIGVIAGYARVFGWIAAAWLLCIALNLLSSGQFLDVAARDVALAVSAFALAQLAPAFEPAAARRAHLAKPAEVHP